MEQHQQQTAGKEEPIEAQVSAGTDLIVSQERGDKIALFVGDSNAAERYLKAIGEFRAALPCATKPTDWVGFGDPKDPEKCFVYLQEYAAEAISRLLMTKFGYTIKIIEPQIVTYPGNPEPFGIPKTIDGIDHLEIVMQGGVEIMDNATGKIESITPIFGSANTADPFFTKKHGEVKDPKAVPLGNLLKKASANYKGNCYRQIWGLKGFTLKDLADCGLDVNLINDSTRRSGAAGGDATEQDERAKLWERILRVHDNKADQAREFLKTNTAKKANGTYPAKEGITDISRFFLRDYNDKTKDSYQYTKIKEVLDKMEKAQGVASEDDAQQSPAAGAAGHGRKTLDYIARLSACKNAEQVFKLEQEVAKDTTLSGDDIQNLRSRISRRVDELGKL